MIAANNTTDVESIEDYTLYCLDRSVEGLDMMMEDAAACTQAIDVQNYDMARRVLLSLADNLHSFDTFEHQLCSLFMIDTREIADGIGNLDEAERTLRTAFGLIQARIEDSDFAGLSGVIRNRISPSLAHFKRLLPTLRTHIASHYDPSQP